ncbi:hypothetical protein [Streptomyces sp. NPDC046727]|uniref:hypothetical protein n=1 Tax=Streptomyces sp. NPDC046727 TaxID=3155373 RepID=UPI0033DBE373
MGADGLSPALGRPRGELLAQGVEELEAALTHVLAGIGALLIRRRPRHRPTGPETAAQGVNGADATLTVAALPGRGGSSLMARRPHGASAPRNAVLRPRGTLA